MLIRLVVKNLLSFKDVTEFNLFPNKTQRLAHHKKSVNNVDFLRLSAIYGANGSGKSNLIRAIALLEDIVDEGKIPSNMTINKLKFKLSKDNEKEPISIGIEFNIGAQFYFYSLTFDYGIILEEVLYETILEEEILIFERFNHLGKQEIKFKQGYESTEKKKLFVEILSEKLIEKNQLLLSFLSDKYSTDFPEIKRVFDWFKYTLVVIHPNATPGALAHLLDKSEELMEFTNTFIPTLNTGISHIKINKQKFSEFISKNVEEEFEQAQDIIKKLKENPKQISILKEVDNGEEVSVLFENDEVVAKQIVPIHINDKGEGVEFNFGLESDGTKRLIEYLPAFNAIIHEEKVYVIDEIERSIHPITIKDIIKKISLDPNTKGQLIFSTHESCLLDQEILRSDEIWLAQKAIDGSSKLYPLSDFNIHHTANIENGYLNGRYGGIPFLSNLKDLNWHKYEISSEK